MHHIIDDCCLEVARETRPEHLEAFPNLILVSQTIVQDRQLKASAFQGEGRYGGMGYSQRTSKTPGLIPASVLANSRGTSAQPCPPTLLLLAFGASDG